MLLALLLAAMVMVPMVSAGDQTIASNQNLNVTKFDVSSILTPPLKFDDKTKVTVNVGLDINEATTASSLSAQTLSSAKPSISMIPEGSIIDHSPEGLTRVFDNTGKQIFYAVDNESPVISTPGGIARPATFISTVPNEAHVYHKDNKIFVLDKTGKLILTVVNDHSSDIIKPSAYHDWLEYANGTVSQITQFDAYWKVPSKPTSMPTTHAVFLFSGIDTNDHVRPDGLLQPVLGFYPTINGQNWYGQAWGYKDPNDPNEHQATGPIITVNVGDQIYGRIYWSSTYHQWYVQLTDQTTGQTSSTYTDVLGTRTTNLEASTVLEAAAIDYNNELPGATEFDYMAFKNNGVTLNNVKFQPRYSNQPVPPGVTGYWVQIVSNPTDVILHTYNG